MGLRIKLSFSCNGGSDLVLLSTDQVVLILLGRSIQPGKEVTRDAKLTHDSTGTMHMPIRVDAIEWTCRGDYFPDCLNSSQLSNYWIFRGRLYASRWKYFLRL